MVGGNFLKGALSNGLQTFTKDVEDALDAKLNSFAKEHSNFLTNALDGPTVKALNGFLEGAEEAAMKGDNVMKSALSGAEKGFVSTAESDAKKWAKSKFYSTALGTKVHTLLDKEQAAWKSFSARMVKDYQALVTEVSHYYDSLRHASWGSHVPLSTISCTQRFHKSWEVIAHAQYASTYREMHGFDWAVKNIEQLATSAASDALHNGYSSALSKSSASRNAGFKGIMDMDVDVQLRMPYIGDLFFYKHESLDAATSGVVSQSHT